MLVKVAAKRNVLSPFYPIYILSLSRPRIVAAIFFSLIVILKQPVRFFSWYVYDQ